MTKAERIRIEMGEALRAEEATGADIHNPFVLLTAVSKQLATTMEAQMEYKVVRVLVTVVELEAELNALAKEGWALKCATEHYVVMERGTAGAKVMG